MAANTTPYHPQASRQPYTLPNDWTSQYKDPKVDYFHRLITNLVQSAVYFRDSTGAGQDKAGGVLVNRALSRLDSAGAVPFVLAELENFRREFPQLFQKRGYQDDLDYIREAISEPFQIKATQPPVDETFMFKLVPDAFKEKTLVLGCGRNDVHTACGPHDPAATFFIHDDANTNPDCIADYYASSFWQHIPDGCFKEVCFEFSPRLCASSLRQVCRILEEGGKASLVFSGVLDIAHKEGALEKYFQDLGFEEVILERIPAGSFEEDRLLIHAYKQKKTQPQLDINKN